MNVYAAHELLTLKLDKINAQLVNTFFAAELDNFLNLACEEFINKRIDIPNNPRQLGFEETTKRMEDLQSLIKTVELQIWQRANDVDSNSYICPLPNNFKHYLSSEVKFIKCVERKENEILGAPTNTTNYELNTTEDARNELIDSRGDDLNIIRKEYKYFKYVNNQKVLWAYINKDLHYFNTLDVPFLDNPFGDLSNLDEKHVFATIQRFGAVDFKTLFIITNKDYHINFDTLYTELEAQNMLYNILTDALVNYEHLNYSNKLITNDYIKEKEIDNMLFVIFNSFLKYKTKGMRFVYNNYVGENFYFVQNLNTQYLIETRTPINEGNLLVRFENKASHFAYRLYVYSDSGYTGFRDKDLTIMPVRLVKSNELYEVNKNPFSKSGKNFINGVIEENSLNIITKEIPAKVELKYIHMPTKLVKKFGINNELPDYTLNEITDLAVERIMASIGNPNYPISQSLTKTNE